MCMGRQNIYDCKKLRILSWTMCSMSLEGDQGMEIWINRRKSEDGLDYSVYTWKRSNRASEIHEKPLEDSETQGDLRDLERITANTKICTINVTH